MKTILTMVVLTAVNTFAAVVVPNNLEISGPFPADDNPQMVYYFLFGTQFSNNEFRIEYSVDLLATWSPIAVWGCYPKEQGIVALIGELVGTQDKFYRSVNDPVPCGGAPASTATHLASRLVNKFSPPAAPISHLVSNPVLPKAARNWHSKNGMVIGSEIITLGIDTNSVRRFLAIPKPPKREVKTLPPMPGAMAVTAPPPYNTGAPLMAYAQPPAFPSTTNAQISAIARAIRAAKCPKCGNNKPRLKGYELDRDHPFTFKCPKCSKIWTEK